MPSIDWTNPYVQGAFVAAVIALVGVVVAALAGFGGAIVGARIGAKAAERTADASRLEAQADREAAAAARAEARSDGLAAREEDRADARRQWLLADRRGAVTALLVAADDLYDDLTSDEARLAPGTGRRRSIRDVAFRRAAADIVILVYSIAEQAKALQGAIDALEKAVDAEARQLRARGVASLGDTPTPPSIVQTRDGYWKARFAYTVAARRHLNPDDHD